MFRPWFACVHLACGLVALTGRAQSPPLSADELEARLAQEARLPWIEGAVLARHPALRESRALLGAAAARASGAERLPDLELKYEQWGVPLSQPYALNRADTLMFGLRQAFPAPGTRAARGRAAAEEVQIAGHQREALRRELLLRARRAYFDYFAADRVQRVQLEHVGVAEQIVNQVRSAYETGRAEQQDVLKVFVELARLHNELAEVRQQRESSRLLLNALMAREPGAALGPPAEPEQQLAAPDLQELERQRGRGRPELAAAARSVRRSQATLDAAKYAARRPSFMLGADYWLMPTQEAPHAYGAMVSMSLPWLNAGHRADVREAEQLASAERHSADALEIETAFALHDAVARFDAASASLEIIETSVLPQAQKSLEAARAGFALGQASLLGLLDALRGYFQVRLEHSRALSRALSQRAEVEFAAGVASSKAPSTEVP